MRILVHIGLNKCASSHVQASLGQARGRLRDAGTWYPDQPGPPCQYGLSRAFGFGPEADGVVTQSLDRLMADARAAGCRRLIVSSEYFSIIRPGAAAEFAAALRATGARSRVIMLSRDVTDWVRSLFNQYVRTVEGGKHLGSIDAYLDQVLANGALRIDRIHGQWRSVLPPGTLRHHRLSGCAGEALAPFEDFAGVAIPPAPEDTANRSVGIDALHRIGVLRQRPPGPARDAEIEGLLAGTVVPPPAPAGFDRIGAAHRARIEEEIARPYRALPVEPLPSRHQWAIA